MTSVVTRRDDWQHGKSKGRLIGDDNQRYGLMAQGINHKEIAVFQPKDWQRIQNSLSKYNSEKEKYEVQKRDRVELHNKSKELVKHWENTIEGQRLKKLQARNIREEQEEIERQKIDIEEAKLQAEKRKVAIDRAKQLQYYETDRVKGFHGALLLTEVLKERDAQIAMKNSKINWQKEREEYLVAQQRKNYDEAMQAEHEKAKSRFEEAFNIAQFQGLQVSDKERCTMLEKDEDIKEGMLITEQYNTFQAAKDTICKHNKEYKTVLRDTYKKDIAMKKEKRNQDRIKEGMADAEIKKFVSAKRKMAAMRQKKEHELFEAFQNHTEKMSNKLKVEMQQKVDDEDELIARAVAEQEEKRLAEIEMKQQAEKDNFEATKQHRMQMISDAKKSYEESLLKDKAFLAQRINDDKNFEKKVISDKLKQRGKSVELQTFHKNQISHKIKSAVNERAKQVDSHIKNTELLVKEEDIFQEYANKVIVDAKSCGRNPFPLIKARTEGPGGGRGPKFEGNAGLRPSYIVGDATGVQLPHYVKDETIYNRVYGHVGKSTNRLGFTW